jgi:nucleoside-diphosphate-sugar epimerase
MAELAGRPLDLETDPARVRPETSEVHRLVADAGYAHEILGWSPRVSLRDGLHRTIEWLRESGLAERSTQYAR